MSNMHKKQLDNLLEKYKAQPVGSGYIDIIVTRENYKAFAKELIEKGFEIEGISWWEYLDTTDSRNKYGMGGPMSRFYNGWFAETCADIDDIETSKLEAIIDTVENKILGEYEGKLVSFKETNSLTPAFWLKVDDTWKNVQQ